MSADDAQAYKKYVEAGVRVEQLGRAIEVAQARIAEAQRRINENYDEYEEARDLLKSVVTVEMAGSDPLRLLEIGQGAPAIRGKDVTSGASLTGGGGRAGRGKNQQAIVEVLTQSGGGLTQAEIISRVIDRLGGGSEASITQATGKLYRDGALRRTGTRGSYQYWAPESGDANGGQGGE